MVVLGPHLPEQGTLKDLVALKEHWVWSSGLLFCFHQRFGCCFRSFRGTRLKGDTEAVVDLLELLSGRIADAAPCTQELFIAALQSRHSFTRPRLELLVFVEPLLRCPVTNHNIDPTKAAATRYSTTNLRAQCQTSPKGPTNILTMHFFFQLFSIHSAECPTAG